MWAWESKKGSPPQDSQCGHTAPFPLPSLAEIGGDAWAQGGLKEKGTQEHRGAKLRISPDMGGVPAKAILFVPTER